MLGDLVEFGIRRNLRVVGARLRGDSITMLQAALGSFGVEFAQGPRRSVYGLWLDANYPDKTFRYCLYGTYGSAFADYLAAIDQPFVFLDVGANQGLFSILAARNANCAAIIAIEPVQATWRLLERNLELNGLNGRARTVNAALTDHCGAGIIHLKAAHSGMATLESRLGFPETGVETVALVDMEALDAMFPADLTVVVKIDVEGHEQVVLGQLLRSVHAPRINAILCEVDERWIDAHALRAQLDAAGFMRFRKLGIRRHYDLLATR